MITADQLHDREQLPEELLRKDIERMPQRMAEYRQLALQADRVIITIICCDSRQVFPPKLVSKKCKNPETGEITTQQVLFVVIPTIGSGAPSRSRLRAVWQQIEGEWGVPADKIDICVTQHADGEELEQIQATKTVGGETAAVTHISCGLRKFFKQNSVALREIGDQLLAWTYQYKGQHGKKAAPDRLELDVFQKEAPNIWQMITELHEKSGKPGFRIPRRLIIRAAYRNSDFEMGHNLAGVYYKLASYLEDDEWSDVRSSCQLLTGNYDHQAKTLDFANPYAAYGIAERLQLPEVKQRSDSHQDPEYVTISFGSQIIPYAVNQILPSLCGKESADMGKSDNAFRTVASIPSVPTLLVAMAEAAYAVIHKVQPHAGDKNFKSLKRVVILCDSPEYMQVVRDMLKHPEYLEEYQTMFKALCPQLLLVNLNLNASSDGQAGVPTVETVDF